jgi:hypothetical protein
MQNTVEHQAQRGGPVSLTFESVAADVQVVADPGASHACIQLTAVDGDANALEAIRNAEISEADGEFAVRLREDLIRGVGGSMQFGGIQVGRSFGNSMFNGVSIGRIVARAILPAGSELDVDTTSGDVVSRGVQALSIRTVSGDIEAEGVTRDSNLNTVSGDIEVSAGGVAIGGRSTSTEVAVPGGGPRINANTVSGNVTGYGVRLRASTVSGTVCER